MLSEKVIPNVTKVRWDYDADNRLNHVVISHIVETLEGARSRDDHYDVRNVHVAQHMPQAVETWREYVNVYTHTETTCTLEPYEQHIDIHDHYSRLICRRGESK